MWRRNEAQGRICTILKSRLVTGQANFLFTGLCVRFSVRKMYRLRQLAGKGLRKFWYDATAYQSQEILGARGSLPQSIYKNWSTCTSSENTDTHNLPEWCRQTVLAGGKYAQHAEDQIRVVVGMKLGKWLSLLVGCCRLLAYLSPMILALEQIMKFNSDGIMKDWQPVDWIMKQTLDCIMKQTWLDYETDFLDWIINSDQYILIIPHRAIVLTTEAH